MSEDNNGSASRETQDREAQPPQPDAAGVPDIIEHVPAVVFRLSHIGDKWRTWFVTGNVEEHFGYTREEFMRGDVTWLDLVHPDDRVLLSRTIQGYEEHGVNSFRLYYRVVKRNGDAVPVTEYNTVNRDADGAILCYDTAIVGNTQDEASKRLIDDHYRQQFVLNDILMTIHDSDLDNALQIILDRTGEYLDTSRALLFKDSPDHKTCKIVYEWCNRDIASVMALDYSITYATGMPEIYVALQTTGNLLIHYGEIPENCREEFEAEGLVASAIFAVYLNGDHYGFVCFDDCVVERRWDDDTVRFLKNVANLISTVLARQDTAARLAQNRRTYEAVLDNVDSFVFVTDPRDGDAIVFANRAFGDDCVGRPLSDYLRLDEAELPPTARGADGRALEDLTGLSDPSNYPELFSPRVGKWLAISSEDIVWVDGRAAQLVNCYDITAKKLFSDTLESRIEERTHALRLMTEEAEDARRKAEDADQAKSQFLASMSHEIRTPMNAIVGLSELLADTQLDDTQREHVKNIRRSSAIMMNIIDDILDISKLETGRLSLVNVHYNLMQAVDHVTSLIRSIARGKGVEFAISSNESLSVCLYGDAIRLRQILMNLLGNAVKFTHMDGRVSLHVDVADDTLTFRIADTGVGIAPDALPGLFSPFSGSEYIHKDHSLHGTGLGLPICKSLVDLMGGSISAESELGRGSVFTFTIPRIPGDEDCLEHEFASPGSVYAPEARVLVVDDIDVNLYVAEAMLDEYGVATTTAASGEEALRLVQESTFDIVFMDHMMPGMDGAAATRAIRSLGGKYLHIPIVALTANVVPSARAEFESAGMNDFLSKPLEAARLNAILLKWLPDEKVVRK